MNELPGNILDCIGNTSLLALGKIGPRNGARILLKLESENPTGSLAEKMGPEATIVTVLCDTGMKYLKTYRTALS